MWRGDDRVALIKVKVQIFIRHDAKYFIGKICDRFKMSNKIGFLVETAPWELAMRLFKTPCHNSVQPDSAILHKTEILAKYQFTWDSPDCALENV